MMNTSTILSLTGNLSEPNYAVTECVSLCIVSPNIEHNHDLLLWTRDVEKFLPNA